jgi:hypothetical protein
MAQTVAIAALRASNLYAQAPDTRRGIVVVTNNGDLIYGLPIVAVPGQFTWRDEYGVNYATLKDAIAAL